MSSPNQLFPHHTPGVEKELGVTAAEFPELGGLGHRFLLVRPVSVAASGSSSRGNGKVIGEGCGAVHIPEIRCLPHVASPPVGDREDALKIWKEN